MTDYGLTLFDTLPKPPTLMPMFRYDKLVTQRQNRRHEAAREELARLDALTPDDLAWLDTIGFSLDELRQKLDDELWMEVGYR